MIPSLVVSEIRSALVEYLTSTFALADDDVRDALSGFLTDHADGIFRGPYLRIRTPFRAVDDEWEAPLDWLPEGFVPYAHQAAAFERLASTSGRSPQPTIVTTGTGSGKTECFLYPILDHCARARAAGRRGIKALLLYPMNALASDQAGRIAELLHKEERLAGVTAGLYVGEAGRYSDLGPDHLVDRREALRADPPDILLTNYKMLDFLLLRREDRDLWATNDPDTLQYVVLDEFHTYDGAQGTDVAMLLRRLGETLRMTNPGRPLGQATAVATSATLGSGPGATVELREFASKVFGMPFDHSTVIGEARQSIDEACGAIDYFLVTPSVREVLDASDDVDEVAAVFCRRETPEGAIENVGVSDPVRLGAVLLQHPVTRAVLAAAGERSRSWSDAVAEMVTRVPDWGRTWSLRPADVEVALARYLSLLSVARRLQGTRLRPLFSIEVQLWIREVSRLLRRVAVEPSFRWRDSAVVTEDGDPEPGPELPAASCRRCGLSGWTAVQSEISDTLITNPATISDALLRRSPTIRTLIRSHPDDADARWYQPEQRQFVARGADGTVPVLVTPDEDAARANRCPACDERDAIRALGLRVASLASVSINTLFGSTHLEDEERKLLAFTDSVQDASHRASFFAGRTHRINLRSLMARIIERHGSLNLHDLGDELIAEGADPRTRYALVPPDLLRHPTVRTVWTDSPRKDGEEVLRSRLGFEADLEFGLRSRVGRTLELSGSAVGAVAIQDLDGILDLIGEDSRVRFPELSADPVALAVWLRGLLERVRQRGGILHPLLVPYVSEGGRQWFVWGGRPDGLPPFTPGQGRPLFFTTAPRGDFDSLTARSNTPSWVVDWGVRVLAVEPGVARELAARALPLLASQTDAVVEVAAPGGSRVFGLDRTAVRVWDVDDDDAPASLRCGLCGSRHPIPPHELDEWFGSPCLRYRCTGTYEPDTLRGGSYYRRLYRSGALRRVVTGEHTGLLRRRAREDLERAFRDGTAPDDPNVIAATPTLEMGIDIGDLSAVMLTSVPPTPANYIQRVGRAGRASGNALITTFVRTDTHGLYYLADPEAMIAGDVRPPNCYLDAVETLQRQYFAFLMDRMADLRITAPPLPRDIGTLMRGGLDAGSILRSLVDASMLDLGHVETFLSLFGDDLAEETKHRLRTFAAHDIEATVKDAVEAWNADQRELGLRRDRLKAAIERAEQRGTGGEEELASLRGQRAVVISQLREHRNEYTLSALERLGLLPNYTLMDDTVALLASLWSKTDAGFVTETVEYRRPARLAIRELAPGNSFYAGGHRHRIDALEIGPADQPNYEPWRLCPECGFGAPETAGEVPARCPRCGGTELADTGARHELLRLRTSLASASEESARVFDEEDDRQREVFDVVTTVDVDPTFVSGAWTLVDHAFGAELAGRAHLRTLNLGFRERAGDRLAIAGDERHVTRFTLCRHCGAVRDVRDDRDGARPERLHQGWCKVRSGALAAQWDDVVLYHQLTTEAVRLLLPVSMFEVDERLASFKGALLLGLRAEFGGDPDHLDITRSEIPNRGGQGKRRFLVLFDRVPGGTGYLSRLADPDRVKGLLTAARDVISRCPCRGEGRQACHRCLLGVVDRNEYDLVRRDLALELLDELLGDWQVESVDSVASIDIGRVEESELERRFKVALQDWAARSSARASLLPRPSRAGHDAFELRIRNGDNVIRWRMEEQEGLSTTPNTVPDFIFHREDGLSPDVAVYLDGYQFHASPEVNNIASDAAKRAGVRASGRLVWNLSWDDVDAFHKAISADIVRRPPPRPLLTGKARLAALAAHKQRSGRFDLDSVDRNPLALLLEYLAAPEPEHWERLTLSAIAGAAASVTVSAVDRDVVMPTLHAAIHGRPLPVPAAARPVAMVAAYPTANELRLVFMLDRSDPNAERWAAIAALPDDTAAVRNERHRHRWADWLQWANLLQFLRSTGRDVIITSTSEPDLGALDDLWVASRADHEEARTVVAPAAPVGGRGVGTSGPVSADQAEELELVEDGKVRELVRAVLEAGGPDFEAGPETPDGIPLEAAWPDHRVAVAPDDVPTPSHDGWDIRPVTRWTPDELCRVLEERN